MLQQARFCLSLLVLFVTISLAHADEKASDAKTANRKQDALSLIPAKAAAAIAIRNVAELTERGDEFIKQTEMAVPMRLSEAYRFVLPLLGLHRGVDDNGSAALVFFEPNFEGGAMLAVPIGDIDVIAGNFRLTAEQLAKGKIVDRQADEGKGVMAAARYLSLHGNHLLMGGSKKWLELAANGKTLRDVLEKDDREMLSQNDILLFADSEPFRADWERAAQNGEQFREGLGRDEAEALEQLVAAASELKRVIGGIRLDDGLGVNLVLQFDGDKSRKVLDQLKADNGTKTSLAGLPVGRVLAAHAARGDGDRSAAVARALLYQAFRNTPLELEQFISAGHQANIVGVFGELWQRIEGSKTALYENENPERDGIFSLIAVIETEDAPRFLSDMTSLARFVNAAGMSPSELDATFDAKTIAQLITQLGDDNYRVRQMATTKLGLVGPPALPALEQAMKSDDFEVQYRATALRQQITRSLAEERKDLVERDLLSRIQPNFTYFSDQERRAGQSVSMVKLRLNLADTPAAVQLRRLLGPQWSNMRLATVGNRIVVLLGSNTAMLDKTLTNLKSETLGFESNAHFKTFRSRSDPNQTAEFHLSLSRSQEIGAGTKEPKLAKTGPTPVTSVGISIAPQQIRLDLFSPYDEAKSIVKHFR